MCSTDWAASLFLEDLLTGKDPAERDILTIFHGLGYHVTKKFLFGLRFIW